MTEETKKKKTAAQPRRHIPRPVIVVAVLGTGIVTAVALSATSMTGPQTAWGQANDGVSSVWTDGAAPTPMAAGPAAAAGPPASAIPPAPTPAPAPAPDGARAVAGIPGIPAIIMGMTRPHADRGTCANCHTVLDRDRRPIPQIHSASTMPHGFRGVCGNCHQVTVARGLTGSPVAGTMLGPGNSGVAVPGPGMGGAGAMGMGRRAPNEADWRGLEVRPGPRGVVATNVEGTAARVGLQPGDVVLSVNGKAIPDTAAFVDATQNGDLRQGTMIIDRGGKQLAFELQPRGDGGMTNQAAATPMMSPSGAMAGQTWGVP